MVSGFINSNYRGMRGVHTHREGGTQFHLWSSFNLRHAGSNQTPLKAAHSGAASFLLGMALIVSHCCKTHTERGTEGGLLQPYLRMPGEKQPTLDSPFNHSGLSVQIYSSSDSPPKTNGAPQQPGPQLLKAINTGKMVSW